MFITIKRTYNKDGSFKKGAVRLPWHTKYYWWSVCKDDNSTKMEANWVNVVLTSANFIVLRDSMVRKIRKELDVYNSCQKET